MSQFLSQLPRQLLQQQQRLTPQLIQAMDILQLPLMALEARIAQEIDGNPALEQATPEEEFASDAEPRERDERPEGERDMVVTEGDGADFERLDNLVREYDWYDDEDYRGTRSRAQLAEEGDMKLEAMNNTASRPAGLSEYLNEQWVLQEVDPRTREIGRHIIDNLDSHGRLSAELDQLALEMAPIASRSEMEQALREVQALDPPGIAARSLQESLLLQLAALRGDNSLEMRIIRDHFDDLQKNRLPVISKALDVDLDEIKAAIGVIAQLRLNPASEIEEVAAPAIIPDVVVEYDETEDRYDVRLTRSHGRELRISPEFRAALEKSRSDKKTREFIKQKIDAANAIIDALRYRSDRLLEVAKAVVDAQRDFLEQGEQHLKVLRMSDLAERFECDPSTISRTVDEKYMQTPRGIYPLRRFFTGGTEAGNGEAIGWDSIKAKVQEIVANEDKANPLNDDEIVEALQKQGIEIKRRTVAKYRAQLGIPPGRQRRQY